MKYIIKRDNPEYGVFIIESMDIENERNKKLDGFVLKTILDLCDIPNEYFYIRTKLELKKTIELFSKSGFGFLHLACHGNEKGLGLTYEYIRFEKLELLIGKHLYHKRLFLSACQAARFELAQYFIPKHHCYSVIGSPNDIDYDKAAVFWSSFYFLMYEVNKVHMPQTDLLPILKNVTKSFNLKLNYYSIIKNSSPRSMNHLREFQFDSGHIIIDNVRKTMFENLYR